jgi:DNA-binding response OmpR family regulator
MAVSDRASPAHSFFSASPAFAAPAPVRRVPTVLLVGDDRDLRDMISTKLYRAGYDVQTAVNGRAAIQAAAASQPDPILLDIMMPGPSGLDVCRKLREDPFTAHIPVIMLTARAPKEAVAEGFGAGADRYMTRPFRLSRLLEEVQALMAAGRTD